MLYIALVSFSGVIEMAQGEIKELTDQALISDLTNAGYIREYDGGETPTNPYVTRAEVNQMIDSRFVLSA
jgi:hypothetical protein